MKLQHHFTTSEQSRRLLELGLPAATADCVRYDRTANKQQKIFVRFGNKVPHENSFTTPCWSVGRLMEIVDVTSCLPIKTWNFNTHQSYIEQVITQMEFLKNEYGYDYSKLEEK